MTCYKTPKYQVGDYVHYYRGWTAKYTDTAQVTLIDSEGDHVVYVLNDGHWCYEGQVRAKMQKLEVPACVAKS